MPIKEILEKLKTTILNSKEDLRLINEMNKSTQKTKEDFKIKDSGSTIAAGKSF